MPTITSERLTKLAPNVQVPSRDLDGITHSVSAHLEFLELRSSQAVWSGQTCSMGTSPNSRPALWRQRQPLAHPAPEQSTWNASWIPWDQVVLPLSHVDGSTKPMGLREATHFRGFDGSWCFMVLIGPSPSTKGSPKSCSWGCWTRERQEGCCRQTEVGVLRLHSNSQLLPKEADPLSPPAQSWVRVTLARGVVMRTAAIDRPFCLSHPSWWSVFSVVVLGECGFLCAVVSPSNLLRILATAAWMMLSFYAIASCWIPLLRVGNISWSSDANRAFQARESWPWPWPCCCSCCALSVQVWLRAAQRSEWCHRFCARHSCKVALFLDCGWFPLGASRHLKLQNPKKAVTFFSTRMLVLWRCLFILPFFK